MTDIKNRVEEEQKIREYVKKHSPELSEEEVEQAVKNLSWSTIEAFEDGLDKAEQEHNRERSKEELLLDYINYCNQRESLVSKNDLLKNPPIKLDKDDIIELLDNIKNYSMLSTLRWIDRDDDSYYFNHQFMTDSFAQTAVLLKEGSIQEIIAERTRIDCRMYPRPVQMKVLKNPPYNMSDERIEEALKSMESDEDFEDIKTVTASNGNMCIYSTEHMSEKYAKALCENLEVSMERHQ